MTRTTLHYFTVSCASARSCLLVNKNKECLSLPPIARRTNRCKTSWTDFQSTHTYTMWPLQLEKGNDPTFDTLPQSLTLCSCWKWEGRMRTAYDGF